MWIILAILKWIGILIGAIVGLLLLLLALAIFVPVRYQVRGSKQEEIVYSFRFSWLLSLVSVKKKQTSDVVRLYVFGIPIRRLAGGEKKKKNPEREKDSGNRESQESKAVKDSETVSRPEDAVKRKVSRKGKNRQKKKKNGKKKKNFSFNKVSSIIGLVKENRKVLRRLFEEMRDLVRYLAPGKIRGEVILGTGDPSTTGLVFGGLSLFPVVYQDGLQITPDFEEKRFQAKGVIKGRLRLFYFLRLVLRLYQDREIKRLWKQINQVKKEAA